MGIFKRLKCAVPGLQDVDRPPTEVYVQKKSKQSSRKKFSRKSTRRQTKGEKNRLPQVEATRTGSHHQRHGGILGGKNATPVKHPQPSKETARNSYHDNLVNRRGGYFLNHKRTHQSSTADEPKPKGKNSFLESSKDESASGTIETSKASCMSFEDLFAGLYLCGGWNHITTSTNAKDIRDTSAEDEGAAISLRTVPSAISFATKSPLSWEENHVLLTEVTDDGMSDENLSLTDSLLQRLRRRTRGKVKEVAPAKTKVYVEPPGTRSEQVSVDDSALTGIGNMGRALQALGL